MTPEESVGGCDKSGIDWSLVIGHWSFGNCVGAGFTIIISF
ncbi:MAG: hypothetical protein ACOC07_13140 [Coleofasciculus sp.]